MIARYFSFAGGADGEWRDWFEFAPSDAPVFDALLAELRAPEEWQFVERETELRRRQDAR
jgi:hypothetical protein